MSKKLVNYKEKEILDKETGELVSVTTEKVYTIDAPKDHFFMAFIDNMASFYKIKSATDKDVIVWLCSHAEYNTGKVRLTTKSRQELCEDLGLKNSSLSRSIKKLKELNLISGESGEFTINPEIFWKGDTLTRKKKITIEFNAI
jgi:Firmicute plasmid replication protein (RepL)